MVARRTVTRALLVGGVLVPTACAAAGSPVGPWGPPAADAAGARLVVRGAGFGHGVGLSQWGARGLAAHGADAAAIVAHYYRGTRLAGLSTAPRVRVALQWGRREATVSGAAAIGGLRVDAGRSYRLVRDRGGVEIRRVGAAGRDRRVGRAPRGVRVEGDPGPVRVGGSAADGVTDGTFRGTLDVVPDGDGLLVVNDLDLEDYLRGVVTAESPSGWPAEALRAQAIVARTYAITTPVSGRPFDQWPDTRSQVYRGVAGETASGDRAVAATRGRVVTYAGRPVTTYFFSTSGGRTEDVQNVFGGPPRPWLRSTDDPYESDAPLHRWTRTFDPGDRRLLALGAGRVRRIEVLKRGRSPRVLRARVSGTDGTRMVSGQRLQRALSLPDTWASYTVASISRCRAPAAANDGPEPPPSAAGSTAEAPAGRDPAGATLSLADRGARDLAAELDGLRSQRPTDARGCRLVGGLAPAPGGEARLQRRDGSRWRTVRRVALDGDGRFDVVVPAGKRWRVAHGPVATPEAVGRR